MGELAGVYGCVINELCTGEFTSVATYYNFGEGRVVFASDHSKAEELAGLVNAVPILEDSILLFDITEEEIKKREYSLINTVTKGRSGYIHVNEVYFPCDEQFLMYCLILPPGYYPTQFYSGKPHFSGHKGDRIAITWWFKEKTTIKVGFAEDQTKAKQYTYIDSPTFSERYPKLRSAYEHAQNLAARIISNMIPGGGI